MTNGHAYYADWDAAYVLGSLSPADRREFETHLESCDRCRESVAELSGVPGLLGRLDADRGFELLNAPDAAADDAPTPLPADLVARIEQRVATRRRARNRVLIGLAAAAVVACAIVIPVSIASAPHQAPGIALALGQVVSSPLTADVRLTSVGWGTKVDMTCRYGSASPGSYGNTRKGYALWVVESDGTASELSSWSAANNSTVKLSAGTSLSVTDIASVQVRSIATGRVLLESDLN
ncbi:MAG TPA: zf-HC2 domain-containing protein [Pseudolysinimonas sp.]